MYVCMLACMLHSHESRRMNSVYNEWPAHPCKRQHTHMHHCTCSFLPLEARMEGRAMMISFCALLIHIRAITAFLPSFVSPHHCECARSVYDILPPPSRHTHTCHLHLGLFQKLKKSSHYVYREN
jgi:hypothetical protein